MTMLIQSLKQGWGVWFSVVLVGLGVFMIAMLAMRQIEESFHKELDYLS
jgi:hypothetical protein